MWRCGSRLGCAHSLCEIEGALRSCEGKLAHLGIEPPARSSLAYANAHRSWRSWQVFEAVLHGRDAKMAGSVAGSRCRFSFKNTLVNIDFHRDRPEPVDGRLGQVSTHQGGGPIWTALICMLLTRDLQQLRSRAGWSLTGPAALQRMNRFSHRAGLGRQLIGGTGGWASGQ